jgi:hypothetical protein
VSDWDDLVTEAGQRPIWHNEITLDETRRMIENSERWVPGMTLKVSAWRTKRLDVVLRYVTSDYDDDDLDRGFAAEKIFRAVVVEVVKAVRPISGNTISTRTDDDSDGRGAYLRCIVRTQDGKDLERAINVLNDFMERWEVAR